VTVRDAEAAKFGEVDAPEPPIVIEVAEIV
jgi:hypothetical protein